LSASPRPLSTAISGDARRSVAEVAFRGFSQLSERLAASLAGSGTPIERFTRMGEAYLDFAEKEPGYYAAMFAPAPVDGGGPEGGPPAPTTRPGSAFDLLVKALDMTFPEGFGTVDRKFVALEVLALAHGIAMLEASSHLPRGPGLPGKHEILRAGVLALVYGASPPPLTPQGRARP
jgi:hypothetical protein